MNALKNIAIKSFKTFDNFIWSDAHLAMGGGGALVGANITFYEESSFVNALAGGAIGGLAGLGSPYLILFGLAVSPAYVYKALEK